MQDYTYYRDLTCEFGIVKEVHHPIVTIVGLPNTKPTEIVIFETGQLGEVFSLEKQEIEVLIFSKEPVKPRTLITRTGKYRSVPTGHELLGTVIDPLGTPITNPSGFIKPQEEREVEKEVEGIFKRARVKKSFLTGVTLVDMMIPLGKGQKELIIGDRKTGKTAFVLTAIKNQATAGTIIIYAAIAKKKSDIKKLTEFFIKEDILKKAVIVATSSHDSPSLIYLTPYAALALAEYFKDQGEDVLLILDDLSAHAKFYREIALLSRRFPGRDSYPGDIFYAHARIMERAGNFKHEKKGEASITCLPIVEIIEGDLTGYISTNVMGMTDGHIFFDSNVYYKGRRPAINLSLSVTRVGRQTQSNLGREINRKLTAFLSTYEGMQNFSHFGAELSEKTKGILRTGDKIYKFFDQYYSLIIPLEVQLVLFALIWSKALDQEPDEKVDYLRQRFVDAWSKSEETKKLFAEIANANTLYDLLNNVNKNREKLLTI